MDFFSVNLTRNFKTLRDSLMWEETKILEQDRDLLAGVLPMRYGRSQETFTRIPPTEAPPISIAIIVEERQTSLDSLFCHVPVL